jgi:hypothetical protein
LRLWGRFYSWDPLHQPGDDTAGLGVGLALGRELLSERGDGLVLGGYECVGLTV